MKQLTRKATKEDLGVNRVFVVDDFEVNKRPVWITKIEPNGRIWAKYSDGYVYDFQLEDLSVVLFEAQV